MLQTIYTIIKHQYSLYDDKSDFDEYDEYNIISSYVNKKLAEYKLSQLLSKYKETGWVMEYSDKNEFQVSKYMDTHTEMVIVKIKPNNLNDK